MKTTQTRRRSAKRSGGSSSIHSNHSHPSLAENISQELYTFDHDSFAPIPDAAKVYFQERLRNRLFNLLIVEVQEFKKRGNSQKDLACRLSKRPEQISRLLSGPANITLDTVSDLLLGLCGGELAMVIDHIMDEKPQPNHKPVWLYASRNAGHVVDATQKASLVTIPVGGETGVVAPPV